MKITPRKSLALGFVAALVASAPALHAQDEGSGSAAADFDQQQIESFAVARAEIRTLQQEYGSKIQQADQEEAAELKQEARQKMATAVEENGLDVQEFNRIAQAARSDEDLQEQIRNAQQ